MEHHNNEMESRLLKILDAKTYSIAEASRLTGLHVRRVSRWLQGYSYVYEVNPEIMKLGEQKPVIQRVSTKGTTYASFLDLIDLLFVKQFLEQGLPLQKVRKALDEAIELLGTNHFARETFFTDGHNIYLEIVKANSNSDEGILQLMTGGQWTIAPIIMKLSKRIDFHESTGFARRWYPLGRNGLVIIDPTISFGRPSIVNRGVTTENIYEFYIGEEKDIEQVCRWMVLKPQEVHAAVDFELQKAA
jgi:DNA-binding transcriptional MerR regulator/uncharacterized protein (DUF433 family)